MHCGAQLPPDWRQSSVAPRRGPGPLDDPLTRNKVSSRCFWNACKALSFGLLLMLLGTAMATIGYYADQLSTVPEVRANNTGSTVALKSRGFHLHNLSYAGPIVMGVGGFIVVAACVMTFEARDSAAKVVPTRFKHSVSHPHRHSKLSPAVSGKLQASVRGGSGLPGEAINRRALTAAFIQFSQTLQQQAAGPALALSKSPSAPNLADTKLLLTPSVSPFLQAHSPHQRQRRGRPSLRPSGSGCTLLNPHTLLQRQALSMDNPDYHPYFSPPQLSRRPSGRGSRESLEMELELGAVCQNHGSQASMAMDLHLPNDCPVTLRIKDRTKRSDTAKRHALMRQSQVADDEDAERRDAHSCSPRLPGYPSRAYDEIRPYSRSTPHSRRESLTRGTSMRSCAEDIPRSRSNTGESRRSSLSKRRYSRTNTEEKRRRGSTNSDRKDANSVSRSASYEKRKYLEPQSSTGSWRSDGQGESGSEHGPEEFDRRSDTFIVIEEAETQPTPSCSGVKTQQLEITADKTELADDSLDPGTT